MSSPCDLLTKKNTSTIRSLMDSSFKKATKEDYVHFVMKNCFEQSVFQNFTEKVEKITGKAFLIESKRAYSWTALHVAAIVNNAEAVKCLLSLGASQKAHDEFNNTPYDYYVMFHHQGLAPFFTVTKDDVISKMMTELLAVWRVDLPHRPFVYKSMTHDFAVEITKLLFTRFTDISGYDGPKVQNLAKNMSTISKIEGFCLEFTNPHFFPRDHFILTPSGHKLPSYSEHTDKAFERCGSYTMTHDLVTVDYPCLALGSFMRSKMQGEMHATLEYQFRFRHQEVKRLPFYLEGGNYFTLTNSQGILKVLIGQDLLLIAMNQLTLDGFFKTCNQELLSMAKDIADTLSEKDIESALKEMYAQGLLKKSPSFSKGLIDYKEQIKVVTGQVMASQLGLETSIEDPYLDMAIRLGHFKPMNLTEKMIKNSRDLAAGYLARKEKTKELMAQSFSVQKSDLHFIAQMDYHLDAFIHSGPSGGMFVQHYGMTKSLLEQIKKNATSLGLTQNDMNMLDQYISIASQLTKQMQACHEKVIAELTLAGFKVVPTPAVFFDVCPNTIFQPDLLQKMCNINFMNAISGWSSKTNRPYWIAFGASTGDHLGGVLMEAFRQFLKSYQPDIEVYFIGNDPLNPHDYSEAMSFLNTLSSSAGPHCMSSELETKSHSCRNKS